MKNYSTVIIPFVIGAVIIVFIGLMFYESVPTPKSSSDEILYCQNKGLSSYMTSSGHWLCYPKNSHE